MAKLGLGSVNDPIGLMGVGGVGNSLGSTDGPEEKLRFVEYWKELGLHL